MRLSKSFFIYFVVLGIVFHPFLGRTQSSELNQVGSVVTSGQNLLGTIPQAATEAGVGARAAGRDSFGGVGERAKRRGRRVQSEIGFGDRGIVYQVHVLGEVALPGTYRVRASSRLAELIELAGGVLNRGSNRKIELKRSGAKTKSYDLYRFLYRGDLRQNPYLMDNDVIYVPLNKGLIMISGAVHRSGLYELTRKENLGEVIDLAGGYTKGVLKSQPIKIVRYNDDDKHVLDVSFKKEEELKDFKIKSGDVIYIPQLLVKGVEFDYTLSDIPGDSLFLPSFDSAVYVIGGVMTPGPIFFTPSFTVRQYISAAGGFNLLAKKKRVVIISHQGKKKTVRLESNIQVNPGDNILVKEKRLDSLGWTTFMMGLATFSLSIASTAIVLGR